MRKRVIQLLIFLCITSSLAAPPNGVRRRAVPEVKILKQINKINDDGSYTFGYEAEDGSFKVETRNRDGVVKGKYGFIDPTGQLKTVEYSAGLKRSPLPSNQQEPRTAATETEAQTYNPNSNEDSSRSDEGRSAENDSSNLYGDNSDFEEDPAFRSFNAQIGQKNRQTSELSKRQGQLGGSNYGNLGLQQQFAGQGQGIQGNQPYVPATQLQGGQFRGQFVDPRTQGFREPVQQQFFQGPAAQPQYISDGQAQYPVRGFGTGGRSHYVGRQYPAQYLGGSAQLGGTQGQRQLALQPQQIESQDEDGFVQGPPPSYYQGGQSPQQQFAYTSGQVPQEIGFGRPGLRQSLYQQQILNGGIEGQQFGQPQYSRFPISTGTVGGRGSYNGLTRNELQEYVPNPELDGFSEDIDQDGFVDPYPRNRDTGSKEEATDEKSPSVKTPAGQKIQQGLYTPQALVPQQVLQGQARPKPGSTVSPYSEQELQQIYNQQGLSQGLPQGLSQGLPQRLPQGLPQGVPPGLQQGLHQGQPQSPFYPQQVNGFTLQGQRPQLQTYPVQQQFLPQPYLGQRFAGQLVGPQSLVYTGGPRFPQYPLQGNQQLLVQGPATATGQRQQQFSSLGGQPQYLNVRGAQFPYDYVGGVGPNGFPLGGPQAQFQHQLNREAQGPSPGPTPGGVAPATSDSKKEKN